jgi:hypothetical protein
MDKPTEHQPLDDFFKRKLNNASVTPRADGWNRLQDKLQHSASPDESNKSRRIGTVWYWAISTVAACLLIVFIWNRQNQLASQKSSGETIAQVKHKIPLQSKRAGQKNLPTEKTSELQSKDRREQIDDTPISVIDQLPQRSIVAKSSAKKAGKVEVDKEKQIAEPIIVAQASSQQSQLVTRPAEVKLIEQKSNDKGLPSEQLEKPLNTERTLIVSVAEPEVKVVAESSFQLSKASAETANENRLSRVLRQIKRLKEGETLAKAEANSSIDEESGLFDRLVHTARAKDNQSKAQKQ